MNLERTRALAWGLLVLEGLPLPIWPIAAVFAMIGEGPMHPLLWGVILYPAIWGIATWNVSASLKKGELRFALFSSAVPLVVLVPVAWLFLE